MSGRVLLLTGPAGSGKSTIATLLAQAHGWVSIAEDEVWPRLYGKNRGRFGSEEHRRKRRRVHDEVFARVLLAFRDHRQVVIEATVHQSPPESFSEYTAFFDAQAMAWELCVLYPRVEIAIARDASRSTWHLGEESVRELHEKFRGHHFPRQAFIDNSDDSPEMTLVRVLHRSRFPPHGRTAEPVETRFSKESHDRHR